MNFSYEDPEGYFTAGHFGKEPPKISALAHIGHLVTNTRLNPWAPPRAIHARRLTRRPAGLPTNSPAFGQRGLTWGAWRSRSQADQDQERIDYLMVIAGKAHILTVSTD